jgi:photoactive yellow protein
MASGVPVNFATLDLLPDGVVLVDDEGIVLYYNAREEQIARRKKQDVIGRNFFSEVAPCTRVQQFHGQFLQIVRRPSARTSFAFQFPLADGPRDVEVTLNSFHSDGKGFCLISVRDITELRSVRDQILRAERLQEVGEVAAGVAHNFNNLLGVIRGNAELLLRKLAEGSPERRRAEQILKAADDGADIVRRIRASTQRDNTAAAHATVSLNEIVRETVTFVEDYVRAAESGRSARITVETNLDESLPGLSGNSTELREVFLNLLRNAVDAIPAEGRVVVETLRNGGDDLVRIADNGEGMSRDVLEKLFRPLFTTKGASGMGMGLATCYGIVRRHGGDIAVESEPGAGTVFTVRLPVDATGDPVAPALAR